MSKLCVICHVTELDDDEPDICRDCQASIMLNKDVRP
jgi:hypothetical protein